MLPAPELLLRAEDVAACCDALDVVLLLETVLCPDLLPEELPDETAAGALRAAVLLCPADVPVLALLLTVAGALRSVAVP